MSNIILFFKWLTAIRHNETTCYNFDKIFSNNDKIILNSKTSHIYNTSTYSSSHAEFYLTIIRMYKTKTFEVDNDCWGKNEITKI